MLQEMFMKYRVYGFLFYLIGLPVFFFTAPVSGKWPFKDKETNESAVCESSFFSGLFFFQREEVVSGTPPNYKFHPSTKLRSKLDMGTSLEDSTQAGDRFRRAFRKGKFKGDDSYISVPFLDSGEFAKVVQIDETGITVDIITYNGQIKQLTLTERDVNRAKVSLAAKGWFERREKAPDSVGPFDIPQFNEEEKYKAMGLRRIVYMGLNKVKRMKYLASKLREADIDPFRTHIVDLVPFIDEHLKFIDQGIQEQEHNVSERRDFLKNNLREEAKQKVKDRQVSLYWFLHWNFRLIWLASLDDYYYLIDDSSATKDPRQKWLTEVNWNKLIDGDLYRIGLVKKQHLIMNFLQPFMRYPEQVYLPILDDLGLMTLNEAFADQDFVKQIINKERMTDGILMNPLQYEGHESDHIKDFNFNQKNEKRIFSKFYVQWRDVRESFTPEEIEMVELVHWYLSREIHFEVNLTDYIHINRALVRDKHRFENPNDTKALLPPEINEWTIGDYFEESAKTFSQIAGKFQADQRKRERKKGWIFRR